MGARRYEISLRDIFQWSIFVFSREKLNKITKATEFVTLGFSFRILVFFHFQETLNVTVCKRYEFFSVLAAIIVARKASDVSQLIGRGFKHT